MNNKGIDKIKKLWDENPVAVIVVASLAANAAAKLLDAGTARSNARTYAKEVDRRVANNRRR